MVKKMILFGVLLFVSVFSFGEDKAVTKLLIKEGARVAVIGDSITEQKKYCRYMELYMSGCYPGLKVTQFQYGWSGERTAGFLSRMDADLMLFKPDVATLCYGMNDAGYREYDEALGSLYKKNLGEIVSKLKKQGVMVFVGSPGAVDTKYFKGKVTAEVYNATLKKFGELAKAVADENGMPFVNVHDAMIEAMAKAKAVKGVDYDVCGKDGFHPNENGHVIMAYAFLKAMGFYGDIGTITIDLKAKATATAGHKIISSYGGKATIESSRYPYCFEGDPKYSSSTSSILPFLPFNADLNRLTLIVKNIDGKDAKVIWGKTSKTFKKEKLEKGINLVEEFSENLFADNFKNLEGEVAAKQGFETELIKDTGIKNPESLTPGMKKETDKRILAERKELWKDWEKLQKAVPAIVIPFKHTISVLQ